MYKVDLSASRHWQELIQQLTHDRWAWEDAWNCPHEYFIVNVKHCFHSRIQIQKFISGNVLFNHLWFSFFFFFFQYWGSNLGPWVCEASALTISYTPVWFFPHLEE
jgi:hypothetical protein